MDCHGTGRYFYDEDTPLAGQGPAEWRKCEAGCPVPEHEHQWVYDHTYEDWWDGDEDDIYKCSVPGCTKTKTVYIPR